MTQALRFDLLAKRLGRVTLPGAGAAAWAEASSGDLFLVDGLNIAPAGAGAVIGGTWRSRRFAFPHPQGFGWVRINGIPGAVATVAVYADGLLVHTTPPLTTSQSARLPAVKAYRWEFEVTGNDRITSVMAAESAMELGA